ncbi:flagellar biosynthesis anti-sigma factor FlgM [Rubeoparvulum massiliense]|uniref:flagellar biosynthesis anti-sigma factor FlgM n=1 Tax=Rubeoparvulum massiliense TaxID=1631346 RepID=UPI00065DFA4D|nr:flagellar biosynthesis anti-sigma factor FlgM [Rubeoparvulum massiliense]
MKIQGVYGVNPYHKLSEGNSGKRTVAANRHDQLQISNEAKQLLASQMEESKWDAERAEKLQSIQERVDAGTYHISTEELAKRMQFLIKERN